MTTSIRTLQTPDERLDQTVTEAGELLGISLAFAYELVARGELPVIRLGRRRLVPKVALLALVSQTSPRTSRALAEPGCSPSPSWWPAPRATTTTCAPSSTYGSSLPSARGPRRPEMAEPGAPVCSHALVM